MWASWWHTARHNDVKLSPTLRDRFAQHFDIDRPPPDPDPNVPNRYQVRKLRVGNDSLTADVGPSYAGCTYSFLRRGRDWVLIGQPSDCWIS
jgi:hypothetical protein